VQPALRRACVEPERRVSPQPRSHDSAGGAVPPRGA